MKFGILASNIPLYRHTQKCTPLPLVHNFSTSTFSRNNSTTTSWLSAEMSEHHQRFAGLLGCQIDTAPSSRQVADGRVQVRVNESFASLEATITTLENGIENAMPRLDTRGLLQSSPTRLAEFRHTVQPTCKCCSNAWARSSIQKRPKMRSTTPSRFTMCLAEPGSLLSRATSLAQWQFSELASPPLGM